jgi:hypothetical protein
VPAEAERRINQDGAGWSECGREQFDRALKKYRSVQ